MNKKIAAIGAALALCATLAGCGSGAGGGGGTPTYHSIYDSTPASGAPAPQVSQSTYHSIYDTPTPAPRIDAQPPQPTAAISGLVTGYDCSVFITPSASGLVAGKSLVVANAYGFCHVLPKYVHTVVAIQKLDTRGDWVDDLPNYTSDRTPPLYPATDRYLHSAFCTPGTYRIYITISGIGTDKKPFGPIGRGGNAITFSEQQCAS